MVCRLRRDPLQQPGVQIPKPSIQRATGNKKQPNTNEFQQLDAAIGIKSFQLPCPRHNTRKKETKQKQNQTKQISPKPARPNQRKKQKQKTIRTTPLSNPTPTPNHGPQSPLHQCKQCSAKDTNLMSWGGPLGSGFFLMARPPKEPQRARHPKGGPFFEGPFKKWLTHSQASDNIFAWKTCNRRAR